MKIPKIWVSFWALSFSTFCLAQNIELPHGQESKSFAESPNTTDEPAATELASASTGGLRLQAALDRTLRENPRLKALSAEITAIEAVASQTRLRPNPELELETENIGGDNAFQGLDGSESTLSFSQQLELWGKRPKRYKVATLDRELAAWRLQSERWQLLAEVKRTFFEVLLAQKLAALNEQLLALAEQTASVVELKVEAGKVSPIQGLRAKVEVATSKTTTAESRKDLATAKRRLVAFWGAGQVDFDRVSGELPPLLPPPSEAALLEKLSQNPLLRGWKTERERREALYELAKSEGLPDLKLRAGVTYHNDTDSRAFVFGLAVPLPIFNRNQGRIAEAVVRREQAQHQQAASRIELETELAGAVQALSTAFDQVRTYRDQILPLAQEAFESTNLGYREGKLEFLDMLEAQRTLFTAKRQYLLALEDYFRADSDLASLVGLDEASSKKN